MTDVTAAGRCLCRKAEYSETENAISWLYMLHVRTDFGNETGNFIAEDTRIGRFAGIKRKRLEHVAEIHARSLHVDDDFARSTRRLDEWREVQCIKMPAFARFESEWNTRLE